MNAPRYALYVMVDEPKPNAQQPSAMRPPAGSPRRRAGPRDPPHRADARPGAGDRPHPADPADHRHPAAAGPPGRRGPRGRAAAAPRPSRAPPAAAARRRGSGNGHAGPLLPVPPAAPQPPACAGREGRPCPLPSRPGMPALRLVTARARRRTGREIAGLTADSRLCAAATFAALPGAQRGWPRLHRRGRRARRRGGAGAGGHGLAGGRAGAAADDRRRAAPRAGPARRRAAGAAAGAPWSPSPAPTARPARSISCASSGRCDGARAASPRHAGPGRGRDSPAGAVAHHARPGGAAWPARGAGRAPASTMRRWRPPRTASTSAGWTACGWPRPASPT